PPAIRPWTAQLETALCRWAAPQDLMDSYFRAQNCGTGAAFARELLDSMNIRFELDRRDLERIPAAGASLVVSNHPYGIVEGLILTILLDSVRPDYRIAVNSLLGGVTAMRTEAVLLNPFETADAVAQNCKPLRQCLDWLGRGGLLAMFPAGEVAHLKLGQNS